MQKGNRGRDPKTEPRDLGPSVPGLWASLTLLEIPRKEAASVLVLSLFLRGTVFSICAAEASTGALFLIFTLLLGSSIF